MPRTGLLLGCWVLGSHGEAGRRGLGPSFHFLSAFVLMCEYSVCCLSSSILISAARPPVSGAATGRASTEGPEE